MWILSTQSQIVSGKHHWLFLKRMVNGEFVLITKNWTRKHLKTTFPYLSSIKYLTHLLLINTSPFSSIFRRALLRGANIVPKSESGNLQGEKLTWYAPYGRQKNGLSATCRALIVKTENWMKFQWDIRQCKFGLFFSVFASWTHSAVLADSPKIGLRGPWVT